VECLILKKNLKDERTLEPPEEGELGPKTGGDKNSKQKHRGRVGWNRKSTAENWPAKMTSKKYAWAYQGKKGRKDILRNDNRKKKVKK